jgi:hypothetical protein
MDATFTVFQGLAVAPRPRSVSSVGSFSGCQVDSPRRSPVTQTRNTGFRAGVNALMSQAALLTSEGNCTLGCSSPLNYQAGNSMSEFNQLKLLAFYFA